MLKFVWRYALTLVVIGLVICGICDGKTPLVGGTCMVFAIATFIDWFKMKWKISNGYSHSSTPITSFTQANYWNSSIVGTPTYLSNLGHRY